MAPLLVNIICGGILVVWCAIWARVIQLQHRENKRYAAKLAARRERADEDVCWWLFRDFYADLAERIDLARHDATVERVELHSVGEAVQA